MPPTLVQSKSGTTTTSSTSLTVTLNSATTPGNCLIVAVGTVEASTNPTVTGITLGGLAGNFASAKSLNNNSSDNCEIWADPNCAGSQTSVALSFSGGSGGSETMNAWVMEWSGLATSLVVDKTNGQSSAATSSYSSGSTGTLSQASELIIGANMGQSPTGPSSPWTNLAVVNGLLTGYQVVSATTAQTYSGIQGGVDWACVIATFKAAAPGGGHGAPLMMVFP